MKHYIYILVACLLWATPILAQKKPLANKIDSLVNVKLKQREDSLQKELLTYKVKEGYFTTILGSQTTIFGVFVTLFTILITYISYDKVVRKMDDLHKEYDTKAKELQDEYKASIVEIEDKFKSQNLTNTYFVRNSYELFGAFFIEQGDKSIHKLEKIVFFLKAANNFDKITELDLPENQWIDTTTLFNDIKKCMREIEMNILQNNSELLLFSDLKAKEIYFHNFEILSKSSNEDIKYYALRLKKLIEDNSSTLN